MTYDELRYKHGGRAATIGLGQPAPVFKGR